MELSAPAADNLQKQLEGKAVIWYNYVNQAGLLIKRSMRKRRKNGVNQERRIAETIDKSGLFKERQINMKLGIGRI